MAKPINQFGGWLRFFQVMNIIAVIALPILSLFLLFAVGGTLATGDPFGALYFGIGIVEMVAAFVISIVILIELSKRDIAVPRKIQKLLTIEVAFAVICGGIVVPLSDFSPALESDAIIDTLKGIVQSIGYFVVWNKYFGQSRRVQAVYSQGTAGNSRKCFVDLPSGNSNSEVIREVPEMVRSYES